MTATEPASEQIPHLPEPSAELTLLMALVRAHLAGLPRKDREAFISRVGDSLGVQEASYNLIRFRPRSQDSRVYASIREARAWWGQVLGALSRMERR